jgi:hypothetical protein
MAMGRRAFMAAILASMLLVSLFGIMSFEVAKANPFSFFWTHIDPIPGTIPPTISLASPLNNTRYASNQILFSFNISKPQSPALTDDEGLSAVYYSLDGGAFSDPLYNHSNYTKGNFLPEFSYSNSFFFPDGNHSITFYSQGVVADYGNMTVFWITNNATVYFTIDKNALQTPSPTPSISPSPSPSPSATPSPTISILTPVNNSFFNVSLGGVGYHLKYETNSSLSWVGYSLDGAKNDTMTGNNTFVHQFVSSNGYHTLKVYANDTLGNWAIPQTTTYFVNFYPDYPPSSSPSPIPTPTLESSPTPAKNEDSFAPLAIAAGLVIAVTVVGLLVILAKRRGRK